MRTLIWVLGLAALLEASRAWADVTVNPETGTVPSENDVDGATSPFEPVGHPHRNRSVFWLPLASLVVPGLDQWIEGQTEYGFIYSGVAIGGIAYSESVAAANDMKDAQKKRQKQEKADGYDIPDDSLVTKDNATRKYTLGYLLGPLGSSGGFSAYHAFRTAVRSHKAKGEYDFLTHEETPLDILKAPWDVRQLAKPRVFIPVAIGAGLSWIELHSPTPPGMVRDKFRSDDAFFTTAYSFNAGMWEEATFRGWLMPVMKQEWFSGIDDGWSNWRT